MIGYPKTPPKPKAVFESKLNKPGYITTWQLRAIWDFTPYALKEDCKDEDEILMMTSQQASKYMNYLRTFKKGKPLYFFKGSKSK